MAAPAADTVTLKQWMRKEDIFDNDLHEILTEQGVSTPDDFKEYTQDQYDELWRRGYVERCKELKDQKAKMRMEKKMKKVEKFWRKASGIKSTSIKKGGKKKEAPPLENSAQEEKEAMEKGADLKKYLQKNQCFMKDLVVVCVGMDVCSEGDIEKIESNEMFDELKRQVTVLRNAEIKETAARQRGEKMMTKFEKLWRAKTGIKKTSIKKKKSPKGKGKTKAPKEAANDSMGAEGMKLKQWMRKNDVWEMALYSELMAQGIDDAEKLKDVDQQSFDDIVRKVRVERFATLKDQKSRQRADKLLVKFEKEWRKKSGIKSTSIKK